jgi:hypothetical protein
MPNNNIHICQELRIRYVDAENIGQENDGALLATTFGLTDIRSQSAEVFPRAFGSSLESIMDRSIRLVEANTGYCQVSSSLRGCDQRRSIERDLMTW